MAGNHNRLKREIQQLKAQRDAIDKKVTRVVRSFSLFRLPFPPGTEIPDGAHLVSDFYVFESEDKKNSAGDGCTTGYHRDRITFDPDDEGQTVIDGEPEPPGILAPEPAAPARAATPEEPPLSEEERADRERDEINGQARRAAQELGLIEREPQHGDGERNRGGDYDDDL